MGAQFRLIPPLRLFPEIKALTQYPSLRHARARAVPSGQGETEAHGVGFRGLRPTEKFPSIACQLCLELIPKLSLWLFEL